MVLFRESERDYNGGAILLLFRDAAFEKFRDKKKSHTKEEKITQQDEEQSEATHRKLETTMP